MIKYQVRSKELIDMINDIKTERLIISPYFQRNLVWRETHQKDFIETILKGYPFPQIFIARGDIDVETMTSKSCVVDGQQRMNAIKQYINGDFEVGGKKFQDLETTEKEQFLTYQIPVIDLDIKATDPTIIDIFKRLNRTFYALSSIEKMATEYATVDFMLIAKYLCGLLLTKEKGQDEEDDELTHDPNMPKDFISWAQKFNIENYKKLILEEKIFSPYETSRMVHLMYTLNLIATINKGYFNRNEKTREILEEKDENIKERDVILSKFNDVSEYITSLNIKQKSMWWNKSNFFTLFVSIYWNIEKIKSEKKEKIIESLEKFEKEVPEQYALAAREAVNNRKQRIERHRYVTQILGIDSEEKPIDL
ncbi:DUF262 domain-containing protein [Thalassospira sp. TSL5-1]|uniref:DUF262 domain-containing protein n=1 Tax=Thalassospira sp. TSL5-1 TaxID=1544451 RepID=UPI000938F951|nr:DUF262 domain-containing protein [Thalassospira sp. TSL5-1]OKH87715.1 hypothetical protein LF95_13255 [Thalassospira sp. TSL5-1]